jgi:hypothetical protein
VFLKFPPWFDFSCPFFLSEKLLSGRKKGTGKSGGRNSENVH